jgi:hypothetical protein
MARDKGSPSKAETEAAHPHAVWIRVPAHALSQRLNALHDAARAIGPHARTGRTHHSGDHLRFGFTTPEHAATFRARALAICGELVEPGAPPEMSPDR